MHNKFALEMAEAIGLAYTSQSVWVDLYLNGELITDLIIPEGIARIPSSAFINCRDLRSVTIGENVTWIGGKAFYGCDGLARIEIPSSLSEIGAD